MGRNLTWNFLCPQPHHTPAPSTELPYSHSALLGLKLTGLGEIGGHRSELRGFNNKPCSEQDPELLMEIQKPLVGQEGAAFPFKLGFAASLQRKPGSHHCGVTSGAKS